MTSRLSLPAQLFAAIFALTLSFTSISGTVTVPADTTPVQGEIA